MTSVPIVTKSYFGDISMFDNLCASIDTWMPDTDHYVLVDKPDMAIFADYGSARRHIVDVDTILDGFWQFSLLRKRYWWKPPVYVARGWIFQQLVKIAFAATLKQRCVVMADSDVTFVRALREEDCFLDDRIRMYAYPGRGNLPELQKWHDLAAKDLGIEPVGYGGSDYILPALTWDPQTVRDMISHLTSRNRQGWIKALVRHFRFSEFILYGTFCERIGGAHRDRIVASDRELCHCSWHYDLDDPAGLQAYLHDLRDEHAAVVIQSNLGFDDDKRRRILQAVEDERARKGFR